MGIIEIGIGIVVAVALLVVYQLVVAKKPVTTADVVAQAKADASAVKKS